MTMERLLYALRADGLAVTTSEWLAFCEALARGIAGPSVAEVHTLARATLVKRERDFDLFDRSFRRAMAAAPRGAALQRAIANLAAASLPPTLVTELDQEGGVEAATRAKLQQEPITEPEATDPSSAILPHASATPDRHDDSSAHATVSARLSARTFQIGLRRLRRFAREQTGTRVDVGTTIQATAHSGGLIDLHFERERHTAANVLVLVDRQAAARDAVSTGTDLFLAVRSEFKALQCFTFDTLPDNALMFGLLGDKGVPYALADLMNKFGPNYRLVFIGDGGVDRAGELSPGAEDRPIGKGLDQLLATYHRTVWLNPVDPARWGETAAGKHIAERMGRAMYPMTIGGLDAAMKALTR